MDGATIARTGRPLLHIYHISFNGSFYVKYLVAVHFATICRLVITGEVCTSYRYGNLCALQLFMKRIHPSATGVIRRVEEQKPESWTVILHFWNAFSSWCAVSVAFPYLTWKNAHLIALSCMYHPFLCDLSEVNEFVNICRLWSMSYNLGLPSCKLANVLQELNFFEFEIEVIKRFPAALFRPGWVQLFILRRSEI